MSADAEVVTLEDESAEDASTTRGFHCVATWKVANFGCCQLECGEELFGPMLSADPSARRRWYLSLFPNGQAGFQGSLSVHVTFVPAADDRAELRASCRVSVLDRHSRPWASDRLDKDLSRFHFNALVDRERLLADKEDVLPDDTLTLRCHVCASDPRTPGTTAPRDARLRALADDLDGLYESGRYSDVTLEARDGGVSAHRAILAARAPALDDRLRELGAAAALPLPDHDRATVDALMRYVYCGRVDLARSMDLLELCRALEIQELAAALAPSEIVARTEIADETFTYTWRLRHFSDLEPGAARRSDSFHVGPSSRPWCLSVRLAKVPGEEEDCHVGVFLQRPRSSGDSKSVYARFTVCLLDRGQQPRHASEAEGVFRPTGSRGFPELTRLGALLEQRDDLLPGDTLTVRCDLQTCDGSGASTVRHAFHSAGPAGDAEGVSSCLGELLRSGRGSDVAVRGAGREFRLHKPVLCARSPVFAEFFDRQGSGLDNCTLDVRGIRPDVLQLLFEFVYTGRLGAGPGCDTAPGLLAAAEHYRLRGLAETCSDFLRSHACEVLSAAPDAAAREAAKDFVCSHAEEVLASDQWPPFARERPRLAADILRALSDGYRRAKKRRTE